MTSRRTMLKHLTAAFMLLGNQFRAMGLKGGEGVEAVLRNSFSNQGKPIGQLETNREQLSFFDALPESAQRQLLEGAIEDGQSSKLPIGRVLAEAEQPIDIHWAP